MNQRWTFPWHVFEERKKKSLHCPYNRGVSKSSATISIVQIHELVAEISDLPLFSRSGSNDEFMAKLRANKFYSAVFLSLRWFSLLHLSSSWCTSFHSNCLNLKERGTTFSTL